MKHITSWVASFGFAASLVCCQMAGAQESFSGKVATTMDAGGYTYVLVDTGTNTVWAAATKMVVNKGDQVRVLDAMPMANFHSKALNRDFPLIYFASSILVNGEDPGAAKLPPGHPDISGEAKAELPPGHPPMGAGAGAGLPAGHPPVAGKPSPAATDFSGITPAKDGKTVAEICAHSGELAGKSVTIRGKVVKYNAEIMNKNWLHIQDGTGSVGKNDLLITTTDAAKLGDTVLVEGKVAVNKDFGGGYKYSVLVEDAKVTVE